LFFADIVTMILLIIWIIYTIISLIKILKNYSFTNAISKTLVSLILISTCATISLAINYTQPNHPEGIARIGLLTPLIITQDYGWTRELYYNYFEKFLMFTLILLSIFLFLKFKEKIIKK
jgi:hypothetical protein